MKVCINPAHLMATPGKCTPKYDNGKVIKECEQNYPIAFELGRQLKHNNIEPLFTETNMNKPMHGSSNDDMYDRISFEKQSGADIYVSIHKNASPEYNWNSISGTETHIYARGANAEKLAKIVHPLVIKASRDKDRGIKVSNYAELRQTRSPAILLELGFMTNKEDASRMLEREWHYKYACAVAEGICYYFGIEYKQLSINDHSEQKLELLAQLSKVYDEIDKLEEMIHACD